MIITGNHLKYFRKSHFLTQREMAAYFGVPRGTYSNWECLYKEKRLPVHVIKKSICVENKIHLELYIKKPGKIYVCPEVKKESIFKRILKWLKN